MIGFGILHYENWDMSGDKKDFAFVLCCSNSFVRSFNRIIALKYVYTCQNYDILTLRIQTNPRGKTWLRARAPHELQPIRKLKLFARLTLLVANLP